MMRAPRGFIAAIMALVFTGTLVSQSAFAEQTRIQRTPYQGQVSKTGLRIPLMDTFQQPPAGKTFGRGILDTTDLNSGVEDQDRAPFNANADRKFMGSGATVDIGGEPMTMSGQLQILSTRNIVILVDKSSSMKEDDCPGGISRWDWCQNQAEYFSRQAGGVLNEGFTLSFFASHFDIFPGVDVERMRHIFHRTRLGLGTHPEKPLDEILDNYFRGSMGQKPLAIAIVSDGDPNDAEALERVISEATWRMRSPDQVAITFLQVGRDDDGTEELRHLDTGLVRDGAKYDIVERKSFLELQRLGLLGALVSSIKATQPVMAKTPPKAKPSLRAPIRQQPQQQKKPPVRWPLKR